MIKSLEIQNYAIIESIKIEFNDGLNIITGETGAGKSILLGALGLIMGNRADTSVLYDKTNKCIVEAKYNIASYNLNEFFFNNDLDYDEICIIRREINAKGKSRAFINDTPVTLNILKDLNNQLIDLHQQFDTLEINEENLQIEILDVLANNLKNKEVFVNTYHKYKSLSGQLNKLIEQNNKALQEKDFIEFQYNELSQLNLEAGELESLEAELQKLENTEDITMTGNLLADTISESEISLISMTEELIRQVSAIISYEKAAEKIHDSLLNIREELMEIANSATNMAENSTADPERKQEVEERVSNINKLCLKHRVTNTEELLNILEELSHKMESFDNLDQDIKRVEQEVKKTSEELGKIGVMLRNGRKNAIPKLQKEVKNILSELSMQNARLNVTMESSDNFRPNGLDKVNYLFSANKGGEFLPLNKVASGGELSRLNLAIKSIVAETITLPTLIFDEIDTGVSGDVALKMGMIMKKMSKRHQIISITHSPQVAAKANTHYYIYKEDVGNRTLTKMKKLNSDERTIEIAKMLSGDPPTEAAISNAAQLIS